jgi:hypothetical protein
MLTWQQYFLKTKASFSKAQKCINKQAMSHVAMSHLL